MYQDTSGFFFGTLSIYTIDSAIYSFYFFISRTVSKFFWDSPGRTVSLYKHAISIDLSDWFCRLVVSYCA